ncbi:MAG: hypothetical protein MJE66_02110 [Proteobacteria bacterium]|nr:hypothetical protein [Pseudomonadota bacterium]
MERNCRLGILAVAMLIALGARSAEAAFIDNAGDPALVGAVLFDFNSEPLDTYFTTRTFGGLFTITMAVDDMHMDDQWCASFGTTGNCLDTISSGGPANDDFRIDFVQPVSAFGFDLNALDIDWTLETYDSLDNLLGSYTIASQSPGLTGFDRRGYAGATESVSIAYAVISSVGNDRALLDNFAIVVPEARSTLLLGLGLGGLAVAGRRRSVV